MGDGVTAGGGIRPGGEEAGETVIWMYCVKEE